MDVPEQPSVGLGHTGERRVWSRACSLNIWGPCFPFLEQVHKRGFSCWEFLYVPDMQMCLACASSCSWLVGILAVLGWRGPQDRWSAIAYRAGG